MRDLSRRCFLKTAALASSGLALDLSWSGRAEAKEKPSAELGGNGRFKVIHCAVVRQKLGVHSSITRLVNDDLLYTYDDYTDAMEGSTGYVLRSTDSGRTWSDPILVLPSKIEHGGIHLTLGMQTLAGGRVLLPWFDSLNRKKYKARVPGDFYCFRSDDNGRTWQGHERQPIGVWNFVPYGKIVELPNGEVLCPGCAHLKKGDRISPVISGLVRSKDQGCSFGDFGVIAEKRFGETDLTLLPDGRLLALLRANVPYRPGEPLPWTYYSHSADGGKTWTEAKPTNMFGQNFNAWFTAKGTLVAACRGIDGSGVFNPTRHPQAELNKWMSVRHTPQTGYGIHFFRAAGNDGAQWEYLFTLPDPAGRKYRIWHESGEPCFCNLANGDLLVGYYSYDESIYRTLDPHMPEFTKGETKRISHVFKRRPCACILREA